MNKDIEIRIWWVILLFGMLFLLLLYSEIKSKRTYRDGWNDAVSQIPSCLYIDRPSANTVKPWGFDGKECVDIHSDLIGNGGVFVSLEKWKQRK